MNGTTNTDRQLIAAINRWRKDRGWFDTNLGWVDANLTVRVRPTICGFDLWERNESGSWQLDPDRYYARTLRGAVDMLVALDILPARFARAYDAGYSDAAADALVASMAPNIRYTATVGGAR